MKKVLTALFLISSLAGAQSTITPNMNLAIPLPGITPGPQWAQLQYGAYMAIDSHNHSSGQGVQIQPNGLNINSDLAFQTNNATQLRTTRFTSLGSAPSNATDIGALSVVGNELYYNDVTGGHSFAITSNGSVNAGAGSITGLPSGTASATYSTGTFVWQSATNVAANMDAQSYILRNSGASSSGLTLKAPTLSANTSQTLPQTPASQGFMTMDASGNMGASTIAVANGITRPNLAPVGQQISSSCGVFSTTSTAAVTNLSVTITTSGRPVMLMLQSDGTGNNSTIGSSKSASGQTSFVLNLNRGLTEVATYQINTDNIGSSNVATTGPSISHLDTPSAGTYTYTVSVGAISSDTVNVNYMVLVAYEL